MKNLFENRVVTFILSLLIALFVWLYVRGELQVRRTIQVKINYLNSDTLMAVGPRDQVLQVLVRGSATVLAGLQNQEPQIEIEVKNRETGPVVQGNLDSYLKRELPHQIEILRVTPREIKFEVDEVEKKKVPITLEMLGQPAVGYQVGSVEIKPDQVVLVGAARILQNVNQFSLGSIDVSGAQENVIISREMKSSHADYWLEESIVARAQIQIQEKIIQKSFAIPIRVENWPFQSQIMPPKIDMEVEGGFNLLQLLSDRDFHAYVDASGLSPGFYRKPIAFGLPKGVKWLDNSPKYFSIRLWRHLGDDSKKEQE